MRTTSLRRLACGLAVVLVWLGFVVGGSHALFSDAVTLSSNSITTGTVDLLISNSQAASSTTFADSRPGFADMLSPGMSADHYLILKNSSAAGVTMEIDMSVPSGGLDADLSSALTLQFLPVDSTGVANGTPVQATLSQLASTPLHLQGITLPSGASQRVKVNTLLSYGYSHQNSSQNYDLVFTGTQRIS
jgi:predicted ribosomally synthesized peptide with SipW-like signal peptide